MTPTMMIRILERAGTRFFWHPSGGIGWEDPKFVSKGDRQLYDFAHAEAATHWDEFYAAVEMHLWRREGVIA